MDDPYGSSRGTHDYPSPNASRSHPHPHTHTHRQATVPPSWASGWPLSWPPALATRLATRPAGGWPWAGPGLASRLAAVRPASRPPSRVGGQPPGREGQPAHEGLHRRISRCTCRVLSERRSEKSVQAKETYEIFQLTYQPNACVGCVLLSLPPAAVTQSWCGARADGRADLL